MADKKFNEFPSAPYSTEKIGLQADPVTGEITKYQNPELSKLFGVGDNQATSNRQFNTEAYDFVIGWDYGNPKQRLKLGALENEEGFDYTLLFDDLYASIVASVWEVLLRHSMDGPGYYSQVHLQNGLIKIGFETDTKAGIEINTSYTKLSNVREYASNSAAIAAGAPIGAIYRTGDALKIVH